MEVSVLLFANFWLNVRISAILNVRISAILNVRIYV